MTNKRLLPARGNYSGPAPLLCRWRIRVASLLYPVVKDLDPLSSEIWPQARELLRGQKLAGFVNHVCDADLHPVKQMSQRTTC